MFAIILGVASACFVLERAVPGWKLPSVKTWPLRVVLVNLIQLGIVMLAGLTWERWLSSWSFLSLGTTLSPWAGGALAYFIATFVFYWWHRVRHTNDWLWRHFHQIHHSPQRLEVITSFYKHPFEMTVNSLIGSLLVYTLLGLSLEGGAIYTLLTALGEFFYHTNVKTPQWVGYLFQRPEMHRIHHQFNYHKNNYGDIVWWDMLFGTYENPNSFASTCGFTPAREEQLLKMLAFKDVHKKQSSNTPSIGHKVIATILTGAVLIATLNSPADACTSFKTTTPAQKIMMAKNYDWAIGDGYVVGLPAGITNRNLELKGFLGEGVDPLTWTSRYRSTAFTQFGVGLAISGMNEKGLVIETLVNATGTLPTLPYDSSRNHALLSLQWVQYQLDMSATVGDVIASLSTIDPVQALLPLHFLACDRSGVCAVLETTKDGRTVVTKTMSAHEAPVLANRHWSLDHESVNMRTPILPSMSLQKSSARRFAKATRLLAKTAPADLATEGLFDMLQEVRMFGLTRWQIVWNLTDGAMAWKNVDGTRSQDAFAVSSFAQQKDACSMSTILAARLGEGASAAPSLSLRKRSEIDENLTKTMRKSLSLVALRTGKVSNPNDQLARAIIALRANQSCQ